MASIKLARPNVAEELDSKIRGIIQMIPNDGKWSSEKEQGIADAMENIIYDALGSSADIVDAHVGDEDDRRYDLKVDYDGCKVTLRAFNGDGGAYMDVYAYCDGEGQRYGDAWGPEQGLIRLDNLKEIIDGLCEKARQAAKEESKCNEAFTVYRGGPGYRTSFLIDCGTPERAKALADAISEEAYGHPAGSALDDAGRHFLGGEIIQFWPVDHFFTASVDPCEKAIEWCSDFLKNAGGEPAITGNDAGLESKDGRQNEYFPQGGIAKHWNGGHWYERNYVSDRRLNARIRLDGAEELIRVGGIDPIHATSVLGKALVELHPRLANGVKRFSTMVHDYMNKKDEPAKNYVCDMVRELLPKAIPAIDVIDVKTAWRKDPDGIVEGISPKLALRKKFNTVDGFLKDLPCFHDVLGKSAKDLYDKGFDLDVAGSSLGDKADAEKEAKRAFDDFDEYIDYSLASEKEDGKDYWYALVKFKPTFWDLADSDLHEVLKLLDDAISEYC